MGVVVPVEVAASQKRDPYHLDVGRRDEATVGFALFPSPATARADSGQP
jgi:hypothetical protein